MNPSGFERSVLWCIVQHLFNLVMTVDLQIVCGAQVPHSTDVDIDDLPLAEVQDCDLWLPSWVFVVSLYVCKLWQAREQRQQKRKAEPLVPWPGTLQARFGTTGCISSEWHVRIISIGFHWILISLDSFGLEVIQNQRADVLEDDMPLAMFQARMPHSPPWESSKSFCSYLASYWVQVVKCKLCTVVNYATCRTHLKLVKWKDIKGRRWNRILAKMCVLFDPIWYSLFPTWIVDLWIRDGAIDFKHFYF